MSDRRPSPFKTLRDDEVCTLIQAAPDVYQVRFKNRAANAYLVIGSRRTILIDVGLSTNYPHLLACLNHVGVTLDKIDMVVLSQGSLATAIRASMAIPGAVNPVETDDDRLLVDGGLTRNLPIDIARQLGVDIIIAVNVGTPLLKREQITSLLAVSEQMLAILTEANVKQSLTELRSGDVLITPVTITHGDLKISVTTERTASQPLVLGEAGNDVRSLVVANSRLEVSESEQTRFLPPGASTVADLVQALVRLKVSTRDVIAVLQSVKAAGALHADLVVQ